MNRRIVDIISDVNLAYSEHARRYLAECGLPKERTYVTGSPMAEVLSNNLQAVLKSDVHGRISKETGTEIKPGKYILLSAHREENIDTEKNFLSLFTAVNVIFHDYNCLQMNAFCVVSDSGTLPEESSFFTFIEKPFPAVCIRTSTERPEALDKGCFILSGIDSMMRRC